MNRTKLLYVFLALLCFRSFPTWSQQNTITTTFSNNATAGAITFNFQNANSVPVMITGLESIVNISGSVSVEAWYKPGAISSPPGVVSTANGWTQFGNSTITGISNNTSTTPQTFFNNLSLVVPANSTYGIYISAYQPGNYTGALRYSIFSNSSTVQTQGGNCYMINGYYVSFAGPARPYNSAPSGTPSGFIGSLTYTTPSACSGTPAPGNTLSSADSTCPGNTVQLSLSNPPFATGITYQWQGSADNSNWSNIPNSNSATYTATINSSAYYRCQVSCGSNVGTSTPKRVVTTTYINCYCTPYHTYGPASGYYGIYAVNFNTLNYTSNNNNSPNSPTYNIIPEGAATTTALTGYSYTLSANTGGYSTTRAWFDWNHNGTMESNESYLLGTNTNSTAVTLSSSVVVPSDAVPGKTRLRLRVSYYSSPLGAGDACTSTTYGEAQDYTITVGTPTPCSGTPTPGGLVSSADTVCPGANFTVSLANLPTNTGLTYQWQGSTDSVNWGNIPNATNNTLTTTLTGTTYYRLLVTCSGSTGTSLAKKIVKRVSAACYCTSAAASTSEEDIVNVTIGGVSNSSICGATGAIGSIPYRYSNYTNLTPVTVTQTQPVNFSVQVANCNTNSNYTGVSIFIDYNQDGDFTDAGEQVYASNIATYSPLTYAGSFNILSSALPGTTVMRVVATTNTNGTSITPCLSYSYGETEDYLINIAALTPCSGTPVPGATISNADSVCAGTSYTLSLPSLPYNSGLTYQWQGSTNGGSSWGNILNATGPTLTISQTVATSYRCLVTCNGSASAYSNPVFVNMKLFYNCYCTPATVYGTSGGSYGYLSSVQFNTLSNGSTYPNVTPFYTSYPASVATTTVYTQQSYNLIVTQQAYSIVRAWIDWNQNGSFEASESYSVISSASNIPSTGTINITVPAGTPAGITKMRIRSNSSGYSITNTDACTTLTYGETEDYFINVIVSSPCSGTPTPGNVISSVDSACSGVNFTLSVAQTNSTGLTYQWQVSSNNTTWTSLSNTNSYALTISQTSASYYRCVVTCANGGASATTPSKYISINAPTNCYCIPTYSVAPSSGYYITNVTFNTLNNTSSYPGNAPYYTYYPQTIATTIVNQGSSYVLTATQNYYTSVQAWIDWNQNGTYETSESYTLSSSNTTSNATITVPTTALLGKTRMRIRSNYYSYSLTASDACTTLYSGETEDYTIFVGGNSSCTGTPAPGATLSSADSVCAGNIFNLTVQNPVLTNGATYQWQYSPDNMTWTDIFNANTLVYSISQSSAYYYRCRVSCGSNSALSGALLVSMGSPTNCYCIPQNTNTGSYAISNITLNTLSNNTTPPTAAPYYTYYSNVSTTLNANNTYMLSIAKNYTNSAAVWFDWNRNGNFESNEFTLISGTYSSGSYTVNIPVPASVASGVVRMRIRISAATVMTGSDACTPLNGETEDYRINVAGVPLAINLKTITARNIGKTNRVAWETLMETGGDYFMLERSVDGLNYSSVSTLKSKGKAATYVYDDPTPAAGTNYYRLKVIDPNGKHTYSPIVKAVVKEAASLIVEAYPNPVGATLNVAVYGQMGENSTVQLIDMTGKVVKTQKVSSQQSTISMGDTAPGLYLLRYTDTKTTHTIKINKQ